ncbi:hypothetical protein DPMN_175155 [Dreissena polymorpha]|uniref:Uncharacterized protein n=1 Tax=Dreissena polymorpha TaxID=45954 RepID=A0A9D4E4P4_DREPO|nr:hypothetical protein DPMN_175155 [Dreissena polymorpha]
MNNRCQTSPKELFPGTASQHRVRGFVLKFGHAQEGVTELWGAEEAQAFST